MRAIMLMFDTLNRRFLPPYGAQGVHAPNFDRLAGRTAVFDNAYGGSMPCMPARREIHTGRHNFLHRSWGPLEPFDHSVPEILSRAGVYTHLVTDHQHYWEDGGATYHNRYDSYEFFRGQEGDKWKGHVADPEMPAVGGRPPDRMRRQDWINRQYMATEDRHPQTRTVDAGLEFVAVNAGEDSWFLQIECFDPHEPFFTYDEHRSHYVRGLDGGDSGGGGGGDDSGGDGGGGDGRAARAGLPPADWPEYRRVTEEPEQADRMRAEYLALLTMCDASLGRVLDAMDEHRMWDDTLLMVCTDHGLLLGEHGWWGKNVQPWYDENIHTPLFVWDPRSRVRGERRSSLVQTVDFGPTLLDLFGVPAPGPMAGAPLAATVADDTPVRRAGLFGSFGGHVNVTDGRYVYMRAPLRESNDPLYEYTLMPTHMASRFAPEELAETELVPPLPFTENVPVLRVPGRPWGNPHAFGTLLFDLDSDPEQRHPLVGDELELRMAGVMVELMRAADAPESQFERLGLPATGPVTEEHLLVREQFPLVRASAQQLPPESAFAPATPGVPGVTTPLGELLARGTTRQAVLRHLPLLANPEFARRVSADSPYRLASRTPGVSAAALHALSTELSTLHAG